MCGIAGYFVDKQLDGKSPSPVMLQTLAQQLLKGIESRGRDATGYAFISQVDKFAKLGKAPVSAYKFLSLPGHLLSNDHKVTSMPQSMVLHARAATKGLPANNWNNHPIYSKETGLCLIHNGWLINDDQLIKEYQLKLDAQVDSEAYLRMIERLYLDDASKNMENAIANATRASFGSIACAMVQAGRRGTLWLWKDEGPISLAKTDWGWVFASTTAILGAALLETHRVVSASDMSYFKIGEIGDKTILRFQVGDRIRKFKIKGVSWDRLPEKLSDRVLSYESGGKKTYRRRLGINQDSTNAAKALTYPPAQSYQMTAFNDYNNYHQIDLGAPGVVITESYRKLLRSESTGYVGRSYESSFYPEPARNHNESMRRSVSNGHRRYMGFSSGNSSSPDDTPALPGTERLSLPSVALPGAGTPDKTPATSASGESEAEKDTQAEEAQGETIQAEIVEAASDSEGLASETKLEQITQAPAASTFANGYDKRHDWSYDYWD